MSGIFFYRNKACISLNCRKLENTMLFTTMRKLGGRHSEKRTALYFIYLQSTPWPTIWYITCLLKYRSSTSYTRSLDPPHANTEIEKQAFK